MTVTSTYDRLLLSEQLPASYGAIVDDWWRPLASRIAKQAKIAGKGLVVGINGPQGSGKSTLTLFVAEILRNEFNMNVATLSLDDVYLTGTERRKLAATVHPLFETRGVPGTHDVDLGQDIITRAFGRPAELALPRFDKSCDDRVPRLQWPVIATPIDLLLFEGWCVGAQPQPDRELAQPVNSLEAAEDSEGIWRRSVNQALCGPYAALFEKIDLLVMLNPPGFSVVSEWRQLQELKLIARTGKGMDPRSLQRFVMYYERLTCHMLETMPATADVVLDIAANHEPYAMRFAASGKGYVGEAK